MLLAYDISADQEEPWRRLLQELSEDGCNEEEYVQSRRRLGISAESVWLVAKRSGGGLAVVYLEAADPKRVLGELVESETPLETYYYYGAMHKRLGLEVVRLPQAESGELLFAWRDDVRSEREEPKNP